MPFQWSLIVFLVLQGCVLYRYIGSAPLHLILTKVSILYPIFPLLAFEFAGQSGGLIARYVDFYGSAVYEGIVALIILNIMFDMVCLFLLNGRNCSRIYLKPFRHKDLRGLIFCSLFVFSAFAYPHAFFISGEEERFNLVSGASTLFISALVLLFLQPDLKKYKSITIFLLLYLMIRGERADILVPLLFYFFRSECAGRIIISYKTKSLLLSRVSVFIMGVSAFLIRSGFSGDYIQQFYHSLLFQNTLIDVIHVYLTGFIYVDERGFSLSPILNVLQSILPMMGGVEDPMSFTEILQSIAPNPGGGLAVTAFYMAFGYLGVGFYGLFFGVLASINSSRNHFTSFWAVVYFFLILRIQWYGVTYGIRLVEIALFLIPFIYFYSQFIRYRIIKR